MPQLLETPLHGDLIIILIIKYLKYLGLLFPPHVLSRVMWLAVLIMWHANAKKYFFCSFENYSSLKVPKILPHVSLKDFSNWCFHQPFFFFSIFSLYMLNLNLNRNTPCKLHDVSIAVTRLKVAGTLNEFTTLPDAEKCFDGLDRAWKTSDKQAIEPNTANNA